MAGSTTAADDRSESTENDIDGQEVDNSIPKRSSGSSVSKRDNDEKSHEEDGDDDIVLKSSNTITNQQPQDYAWEKRLLETLARVSLASVGGGLVGLSLDHTRRQQQQQHQQYSYPSTTRTGGGGGGGGGGGNRPPRQRPPPVSASPTVVAAAVSSSSMKRGASLAKTWSVSCFLFAAIIETTRWISPTTVLYDFIVLQQQQQKDNDSGENVQDKIPDNTSSMTTDTSNRLTNVVDQHDVLQHYQHHHQGALLQRVALTVTGDYTIGGSLAGFMVASLAHQKHHHARNTMGSMVPRPALLFGRAAGVGLGTALGLCAGVVQATIAVGEVYIQQQQEQQQRQQQQA